MYAVICSPKYWKDIDNSIASRNDNILYSSVEQDIDITAEFDKISRLSIKYLIIDLSCVQEEAKFLRVIKSYRITHNDTQIIIIAPNCQPGNKLIHSLVTIVGIKDILNPSDDADGKEDIGPALINAFDNPAPYKSAVKWIIDGVVELQEESKDETAPETIVKTVRVSFKKLVITVWDNAEFACELAYNAAKNTNYDVLLIDADLLAPKADFILNLRKYPNKIVSTGTFGDSGINIILDSLAKNTYSNELLFASCVQRKELKNLHILTGNYDIGNYEYYNQDSYVSLIEKAYQNFDITIIAVNRSIYDAFTLISLVKSDYNLIPTPANLNMFREFNSYLMFLNKTQNLPLEKSKFIAYEYQPGIDMEKSLMKELSEKNYIGSISYSTRRQKYRNLKAPYVRRMDQNIVNEYIDLLAWFNVVKKRTWRDKLLAIFARFKFRKKKRVSKIKTRKKSKE